MSDKRASVNNSPSLPPLSNSNSPVNSPLFVNKWSFTIISPTLTLKTWLEPSWTINKLIYNIKKKFSEEADNYILFLETDKNFLTFDGDSMVNSFSQLANNSELIFREKKFTGTKGKPVIQVNGKRAPPGSESATLRSPESARNLLSGMDSPKMPSPLLNTNNSQNNTNSTANNTNNTNSPAIGNSPTIPVTVSNNGYDSTKMANRPKPRTNVQFKVPARPQRRSAPTMTRYGTMRSVAEQEKLDSFFETLVQKSCEILSDVKDIKEMLNSDVTQEELFESAKGTAQRAVELITIVMGNVFFAKEDPDQFEFVKDGSKLVRAKVLELLQSARNCAANRFDFLTQQQFSNCCKDVVDSIKRLIDAADMLQTDDVEKAKQDERIGQTLIKHTNALKVAIKTISNAVYKKEKEPFVIGAKTLISSMNELLEAEQLLKLKLYWQMKTATQNFVGICKQVLSRPDLPYEQVTTARAQLVDSLHAFVKEANTRSVEVRKALKKKEIYDFAPKPALDPNEEKDYRMKKNAVMKLTNVFTSKFDGFFKQWMQQTPEDAEEIYEQMVEELNKHFLMYVAAKEKEELEKREKERLAQLKANNNQQNEENDEEDQEAMKELAKILKMKTATDWQEMALNLRRFTAKMDISKRTMDLENSKDAEINHDNIQGEFSTVTKSLHDTTIELLLTISDMVLTNSDEKKKKTNKPTDATLTHAVENSLKILRRTLLVCKAWVRPTKKKQMPNSPSGSQRKSGVSWALSIECQDDTITYVKKLKFDTSTTIDEVIHENSR